VALAFPRRSGVEYSEAVRRTLRLLYSLAFRTGCYQSVVMHTYTWKTGLDLRFRVGSLHSCPQGLLSKVEIDGSDWALSHNLEAVSSSSMKPSLDGEHI